MTVARPILDYCQHRGRDEVLRLTLVLAGVDYVEVGRTLDPKDLQPFPSVRCPRYVDEAVEVGGYGTAAARHLGRKYDLYGAGLREQAYVDMLVDAVEDVRRKYLVLIYGQQLFGIELELARQIYWGDVLDPASAACQGIHFSQLSHLLLCNSNGDGNGWAVGDKPSIADVLLFDIIDLHCRVFGEGPVASIYPDLVAFKHRFASLPRIETYLSSSAQGDWGRPELHSSPAGSVSGSASDASSMA